MSPCGQVIYCDFQDDFMVFLIQILDIFVKFAMNYFIFSFAFVTGIHLLTSAYYCFLVFMKIIAFFILVLLPNALPKFLIILVLYSLFWIFQMYNHIID